MLYSFADLFAFYACKWAGCTDRFSDSADKLYKHVLSTHITPDAQTECSWSTCDYPAFENASQASTTTTDLVFHVRTHIPIHTGPRAPKKKPTAKGSSTTTGGRKEGTEQPLNACFSKKWETPNGGQDHGAMGIGYVALLVIRNLVQCVAGAVCDGAGRQGESMDRREARDQGIFGRLVDAERNAAIARGEIIIGAGTDEDEVAMVPDASGAAGSVIGIEGEMVKWAEMGAGVAAVAGDVLSFVDAIGRALEERIEEEGEEQRMEF